LRKYFLILFLLPHISLSQLYKVTAEGGLNVREKPGGKKIATLLKDDYVYVYWKSDKTLTVTDIDKNTGESKIINGNWVSIITLKPPKLKGDKVLWEDNYNNSRGVVFDGFLQKLNAEDSYSDLIKENYVHFDNESLDISSADRAVVGIRDKCFIKNKDGTPFTGTAYYLDFKSSYDLLWNKDDPEEILLKTISFKNGFKNGISRIINLETGKVINEKIWDENLNILRANDNISKDKRVIVEFDNNLSEVTIKGIIRFGGISFDEGGDTYEGGIYITDLEYISSENMEEFKILFKMQEYHDWANIDYIDKEISISLKAVYEEEVTLLGDNYEGAMEYFYRTIETGFCVITSKIIDIKLVETLDGEFKSYYDNGQLKLLQNYKNGIKHGVHKSYSDIGDLIYLRNYLNGKLDGLEIEKVGWGMTRDWYLDSIYWKNGEQHGIKKSYRLKNALSNSDERILMVEEHWKNGTNQLTKWYHTNGKVQSEGKWERTDYPVGIHKKYYFNGQLESEGELNGYGTNNYYKHEGRHVKYSQYGEIIDVKFYENDIEINRTSSNKFVGTYSFGDDMCENGCGELLIHPNNDGTLQFYLSVNRGAPNYNSGAVKGNLIMTNPNTYIYTSNQFGSCKLSFELNGNIIIVRTMENSNNCGFGYNVYADGSYKLLNNFIPEFFTNGEGSKILF